MVEGLPPLTGDVASFSKYRIVVGVSPNLELLHVGKSHANISQNTTEN